jgi:hypothetical protein
VRADLLDAVMMNLIRRTLITPKAIREMIDSIYESVRLQGENRAPELGRPLRQIATVPAGAGSRRSLRLGRRRDAEASSQGLGVARGAGDEG